ncbi:MAG: hypothetical protein ACREP9_02920 [Candidatus Dormibacteraceae bacterium]
MTGTSTISGPLLRLRSENPILGLQSVTPPHPAVNGSREGSRQESPTRLLLLVTTLIVTALVAVLVVPAACHVREQYANNPNEVDHGRLKS